MVAFVRVALVGSFLLFLPGLLEQFEAPKAAVVRIVGLAAAAAWLARGRPRLSSARALDLAVLGWLGVEMAATVASLNPRISIFGDLLQREGLFTSLGLAGIYLASRLSGREPRTARATLHVALAGAGIASLYALLQATGLDPVRWAGVALYTAAEQFPRPFGTLGHPNILGVTSAAAFAAAVALALGEPRRALVGGALAALFAATTVATLSRGAWLGALAGGFAAAAFVALERRRIQLERKAVAWVAGVAIMIAAVFWLGGFGSTLAVRFSELLHPESGSARSRLEIWRIALLAWKGSPWLGHGPDTFQLEFQRFQTPAYWRYEWATVPGHAHSIYLQTLATRGILGAAAGLALAIGGALAATAAWRNAPTWRPLTGALGAMIVAMAVAGVFGVLGMSGATLLAFAGGSLASLGAGGPAAFEVAKGERPTRGRAARGSAMPASSRWRPGRTAWVSGVAAACALVWSVADLLALRAAFEGMDWVPRWRGDGDAVRAASATSRAVRLMPWDDVVAYYRAQTLTLVADSFENRAAVLDQAEASARRGIELAPGRAIDYQALGTVLLARARWGDAAALPGAEAAFAAAMALAPYNALMMMQLAQDEIEMGRPQAAAVLLRRAHDLYPEQGLVTQMLDRAIGGGATAQAPGAGDSITVR
jgi:O-antigen ligase